MSKMNGNRRRGRKRRRDRKNQNEKVGRYTDPDGYKRSIHESAPLEPPPDHQPPLAETWTGYPCSDQEQILKQAVRRRWNIPDEVRDELVNWMITTIQRAPEYKDKVGAGRVLVQMEKQNQDDSIKKSSEARNWLQVINQIQPSAPDPEYLEWKRRQLIEQQNRRPLEIGAADEPAPLENRRHTETGAIPAPPEPAP